MATFSATHVITVPSRGEEILVEECDGVLYTKAEVESETAGDWEYDEIDGLTFQGGFPAWADGAAIRRI